MRESVCPRCGSAVDLLRARHVAILGGKVVSYCSAACKAGERKPNVAAAPPPAEPERAPREPETPRRGERWRKWVGLGSIAIVLGAGSLLWASGRPTEHRAIVQVVRELRESAPPPAATPAALARAWIHPLIGGPRRLPEGESRRFGAHRDHAHPRECRNGHCGVDLAARPGEPVLAVTDGRIERIREEKDGLSGRYVRIVHPAGAGAIVTWYMHLDRIRHGLNQGDYVRAGEQIGTTGRTGIETSEPHLHFAVTLRFGDRDLYTDPLPLLERWQVLPAPLPSADALARSE